MSGIADDRRVEVAADSPREAELGGREPGCRNRARTPGIASPLPNRFVALDDLDSRASQQRDRVRVARIVALVRAEVENPQRRISSTCRSAASRSAARSS
jgi:hypothetical protein